jgi:acetyl-CoA carboxylase carboxyltransferase component
MVWFIDSAGARIDPGSSHPDMISLFAGSGHLFREQVIMSGVVPQVAAMVGPGAAGTAYIPGLADFVPMVKGIGLMALGGPPLVKAVTGRGDRRAGPRRQQGPRDQERRGRRRGRERRRVHRAHPALPLVLPLERDEAPPTVPCTDPIDRRDESLLDLLPENSRKAYDMYKLIHAVVDHGEILDLKPRFARSNIITCLARIGGTSVGVVASQPNHMGGVLDVDSSDKAARFIQICDAFGIPLVFLQDVPGFMVGSKVEHEGIIRHGAKMLHVMSAATVPKLTVVVRKAYGAGYYVMCGRAYEPDLIVALAHRRDQRHGPRGHGGHRGQEALRRHGAPARGEGGHHRADPARTSTSTRWRAGASSTTSSTLATRAARSPGASSCRATRRSSGPLASAASSPSEVKRVGLVGLGAKGPS